MGGSFIKTGLTADNGDEFAVLCDGNHNGGHNKGIHKTEWGDLYKVIGEGGPENTKIEFEELNVG